MIPRHPAIRSFIIGGLIVAALAAPISPARAGSIEELSVRRVSDRYWIELHAHLDARAAAAYAVFANLANLPAINTDVRRVEVTGKTADDAVQVYTEIRACVLWWYCRSIRETQKMTFTRTSDGGDVAATVLAGGDLRDGQVRWVFRNAAGETDLRVTAELEPAFRVPPLIGPWLVKRWLRIETAQSSANIEKLARRSMTGAFSSMRARTGCRQDP